MKCLSLWQPWASWMAWGVKRIETRSWLTSYKGPLLIHAAKTREEMDNVPSLLLERTGKTLDDFPFGAIVGMVELIECRSTTVLLPQISEIERNLGNYEPGRFGWITAHAVALESPIPYRGQQGLFDVPDDVVRGARVVDTTSRAHRDSKEGEDPQASSKNRR